MKVHSYFIFLSCYLSSKSFTEANYRSAWSPGKNSQALFDGVQASNHPSGKYRGSLVPCSHQDDPTPKPRRPNDLWDILCRWDRLKQLIEWKVEHVYLLMSKNECPRNQENPINSRDIKVRLYVIMFIPSCLDPVKIWLLSCPFTSSSLQTPLYCPRTLPHYKKANSAFRNYER